MLPCSDTWFCQAVKWQAGITRLLKYLIPSRQLREDPKLSLFWLLNVIKLPDPSCLLRFERLRLLQQILLKDSAPLRQLLESAAGAAKCWISDVISDLHWLIDLCQQASWTFPLGRGFNEDLHGSFDRLRQRAKAFGGGFSARNVSASDIWQRLARDSESVQCTLCAKSFKGARGLKAHLALCHGIYPLASLLVHGMGCPACQRDFHCRRRAVRHVQRSETCLQWLKEHVQPVVPDLNRRDPKIARVQLRAA